MVRYVPKDRKKGLKSLVILVCCEIWNHWNACGFEGAKPCISVVLQAVAMRVLCGVWLVHQLSQKKW